MNHFRKIKKLILKIRCFLTGGHRYDIRKVRIYDNSMEHTYEIKNTCSKCGTENMIAIPGELFYCKGWWKK